VPYVTIESGTISANETLRLQVIFDVHSARLLYNGPSSSCCMTEGADGFLL
jgi:hypothetical protein